MGMLILITLGILAAIAMIVVGCINLGAVGIAMIIAGGLGTIILPILYAGLRVVGPNEALVLTLFGNYHGTILKQGFYFVNPFSTYTNPTYTKEIAAAKAEAETQAKNGKFSLGSIKVSAKKTVSLKDSTLNNGVQKVNDVMGNPIIIGAVVIWKVVNPTNAVFRPILPSEILQECILTTA